MKVIKGILEIIILVIALVFFSGNIVKLLSDKILHSDYVNVFGFTYLFIEDDKMAPDIENGNMILIDIGTDVEVGDIITYYDAKEYKTSKVISIDDDKIITRDSQSSVNNPVIIKEQIVGKLKHTFQDGNKIKKFMDNKLYIKWLVIFIIIYLIISVIDVIIDKIIGDSKNRPSRDSKRVDGNRFIRS